MTIRREGLCDRITFCLALGVTTRTVDKWVRNGLSGFVLPCEYVGRRLFIHWDAYREWQQKVASRQLGFKPVARKSSPEAMEVLRRNGYFN